MNRDYLGKITLYNYLGGGAYSDVYSCDYWEQYFAYKKIQDPKYAQYIDKNINELTNFYGDNDFLFPYKTIYKSPKDTYLDGYVLDPLYQFKELNNVNEDKIKILLKSRELLEKFHNKYNYVHTDICPWNYLYNQEKDELILIDFDSAINLKDKGNINLDLINFYAAEYIEKRGIDKDLDIYLFNLMTYAILNDIDYNICLNYIKESKELWLNSEKATKILKSYKDLGSKTLKKEYIIDYLK